MIENNAVIHIGVSGHRFLDDTELLKESIREVLKEIYFFHSMAEFHLYSPLAAGADQLAAECGLENPRTRLIVLLPMPLKDYLRDFSDVQKQSFGHLYEKRDRTVRLPLCADEEEMYLKAGKYIIDHSDYLITLWNGKPKRGKGGTAQVVNLANIIHLPTAWIRANNAIPGNAIPLDKHYEQGSIEYLNWHQECNFRIIPHG
jgi:hypothetical protein